MNRRVLSIGAVALLVLLAGCASVSNQETVESEGSIDTAVDSEAGVVCFLSSTVVDSGIDCLPVDETEYDTVSDAEADETSRVQLARVVNSDAGVVCYRPSTVVDAGVACVPVEDTSLNESV